MSTLKAELANWARTKGLKVPQPKATPRAPWWSRRTSTSCAATGCQHRGEVAVPSLRGYLCLECWDDAKARV